MPDTRPYRFALLSHVAFDEDLRAHCVSDGGFTLDYVAISYSQPLFGVRGLLEQGYEVILFYSSLGPNILNEAGHSVVLIPKTDTVVIRALLRAREVSREVVLPVQENENVDIPFLEGLLDMRIHPVHYDTMDVLQHKLGELIGQGQRVILGGGVSAAVAQHYGVSFFRVPVDPHGIRQALEQAKGLARAKREEGESKERLVAMLRLFREGVICVDEEGSVVFSNNRAYELLDMDRRGGSRAFEAHYPGLLVTDVLTDGLPREDAVVSIKGEQLLVTTLPVYLHSGAHGAVAFISNVNAIRALSGRLREHNRQVSGFVAQHEVESFRGRSPAVLRLKNMARLYAPHVTSVFIHGETGTGKEVLAQGLHNAGPRRDRPFVAVNCAALPDSLLESELFGYEEGAFTGAKKGGKPGVFEMAHKGTLFLDEIGDMGADAQLRLLRVLESRELVRVGGNRVIPVDIRVVSASHKPLTALVKQGSFRQDLFYRLAVLRLHIPPLRERMEDVPLILEDMLARYGKGPASLTAPMLAALGGYAWPGNVRELLAFVESYLILLGGRDHDEVLFLDLLRDWSRETLEDAPAPAGTIAARGAGLRGAARDARLKLALDALRANGGNRRRAAAQLGVSYNTLWRILGGKGPQPR